MGASPSATDHVKRISQCDRRSTTTLYDLIFFQVAFFVKVREVVEEDEHVGDGDVADYCGHLAAGQKDLARMEDYENELDLFGKNYSSVDVQKKKEKKSIRYSRAAC